MKISIDTGEGGIEFALSPGENLYSALTSRGIHIQGPCQGRGLCGLCRVKIEPPAPGDDKEEELLAGPELREGWRLACRQMIREPADITLPEAPAAPPWVTPGRPLPEPDPFLAIRREPRGDLAVISGDRLIEKVQGQKPPPLLAAAADVGTTNVSLQLMDLNIPAILGTAVTENPQVRYGEDVISRIKMAARPEGLELLGKVVIGALNDLLDRLQADAGLGENPIFEMSLAANPAMSAIFAGVDPSPLASPPYRPVNLPELVEGAADRGLRIHPRALVRLLPAVGAFVGGDVIAGLVHQGLLPGDPGTTFYIDLGTNGEMVLKRDGSFLATSAAAGPALEGRIISCGMRAEEGAIDSITLEADVAATVIGDSPPRGVCGSGLLDLLAGLLKTGLVHPDGNFMTGEEAKVFPRPRLAGRLGDQGGQRAFLIHRGDGPDLYLTQSDIRALQLTKGAISTGIQSLMEESDLQAGDVERVVVAGIFGFHLDPGSMVEAGFFPPEWRDRVEFAGNAALSGARDCLLHKDSWNKVSEILGKTRVINLAEHPRFMERFIANLPF